MSAVWVVRADYEDLVTDEGRLEGAVYQSEEHANNVARHESKTFGTAFRVYKLVEVSFFDGRGQKEHAL